MKPEERSSAEELASGGEAAGIECPHCGCRHMLVRNTRPIGGVVRRYRVCRHCGANVRTTESRQPGNHSARNGAGPEGPLTSPPPAPKCY